MRLAWFLLPCLGAVLDAQGHGHKPAPLFGDPVPVTLRLDADFHALFRDRGTQKTDHPAQLWYAGPAGSGTFAVRLRTRGIFRLKHCSFPPIRLDVTGNEVHGTLFAGQKKLKLVTHCQANPSYERNLLREYALYRVFNALTDTSFRVRLAHVTRSEEHTSE